MTPNERIAASRVLQRRVYGPNPPDVREWHRAGSIDGVTFSEAWESRETVEIIGAGAPIYAYYLGKEALLKNKKASGRPIDLEDLQNLE